MIVISAAQIPLEGTLAKFTGTAIVVPVLADTDSTLTVNPLPTTGVFATVLVGVTTVCVFVGVATGVVIPPPFIEPALNVADTLVRFLSPNVASDTLTFVLPEFKTLNVRFVKTPFWLIYPFDIVLSRNNTLNLPFVSLFIPKFTVGFVTILPASPLTYSSLLAS
ncbi:MAG: hypothetical protein BWY74_03939 [Firmicutes bacterium ADurb.Bin419]|nr:MAG: hypothetical protein BWY74_03939 [Firmicutes bacterium ADurb.Bin419]